MTLQPVHFALLNFLINFISELMTFKSSQLVHELI